MSERMTAQLVIDDLQMAIWHRKPSHGLILHSDRGSQYCSHEYQKLLTLYGLIYRKRLHSGLGYKSPVLFEVKMLA